MKFNPSYIIASLCVIVIAIWFFANSTAANKAVNPADKTEIIASQDDAVRPQVIVSWRKAEDHQKVFTLYGRTEPKREVAIKAETAGLVIKTPAREGSFVTKNTIICQQDIDARQARLDEAKALLKSREFDVRSTQTLVEKGYRSPIQLETLKAQLDGARAGVKQAEIELDNVNMRAPFSGIFQRQMAETGDYLLPGQACGQLLELNPLVVTVELTEQQVGQVKIGQSARVELATGQSVTGVMTFIDSQANNATRTFRTEIEVSNKDMALKGGVTATVDIKAGTVMAQHIPSKILTLNDNGSVGVRYVDDDDIVRFVQTTTIDEDATGLWVTGLPDTTRIIIQGQDYVSVGTKVKPLTDGQAL